MPTGLRHVAQFNPLTYVVDCLRGLMIESGQTSYGAAADFAIMFAWLALLVAFAARLYPNLAR